MLILDLLALTLNVKYVTMKVLTLIALALLTVNVLMLALFPHREDGSGVPRWRYFERRGGGERGRGDPFTKFSHIFWGLTT